MRPNVAIANPAGRTERMHAAPRPLPLRLPLVVCHAGNARWREGTGISIRRSTLFAVELVCAGNVSLRQEGREYTVGAGELYILRRGADVQYRTGPAGFVLKRFIGIEGSVLDMVTGELGLDTCDVLRMRDPGRFVAIVKEANSLLEHWTGDSLARLALLAYRALITIAQDRVGPVLPPAVASAVDCMQQNIQGRVSVARIARQAMVSPGHLYHLFGKHLGCAPLHYFSRLKMNHAAGLLRHSFMPVKEIACRMGFEEPAAFAASFRKHMGLSPRQYRMKYFGSSEQ